MNGTVMGSEISSGCESGWTLYLEHSFLSHKTNNGSHVIERGVCADQEKKRKDEDDEEEEEDLSMVSDASSGPPHFHEEDDYGCFYNAPIDHVTLPKNNGRIKRKIIKEDRGRKAHDQEHHSFLDDTASSPVFNFSNNNFTPNNNQASMENILEFSQGHSATHIQGRSAFQGHVGFFQSSLPGNQQRQNQWFEEKRWG